MVFRPYRNQAGRPGLGFDTLNPSDTPENHRLLDQRKAPTHLKHTQTIWVCFISGESAD